MIFTHRVHPVSGVNNLFTYINSENGGENLLGDDFTHTGESSPLGANP
jgi:hypothetical protein